MKPGLKTIAAVALSAAAGLSQAAQFDFSGTLAFDNSIASIGFQVSGAGVGLTQLWTDSAATGFDPVIQLWSLTSPTTGVLLGESDDDTLGLPGQTGADAGLTFAALTAGNYLITVVVSPNFAISTSLADGFVDSTADALTTDATSYGVHLQVLGSGVSVSPVPEPAAWATMLLGVAGLSLLQRRRRHGDRTAA